MCDDFSLSYETGFTRHAARRRHAHRRRATCEPRQVIVFKTITWLIAV